MSRFILVFLFSSIIMNGWAQATQPCIVTQYNQKRPKTPLAGVEVMASNAGSTVSASDGRLTLSFRTLKPGDKVKLISAKKAGFEIFNSEAVEQWNISRNSTPFTLVLVKSEYFSQLKGKLTQSSTDSYKSKYQQAVRELEQQRKAGKLKAEEYSKKCDELEERYQEQLKNLDNYIDQFARIDLSEISVEEQRILDMVQEGRIDEAVKAYEDLDISGKLRQARENKKALSEAKNRIEEEEAHQDQTIEELIAKLEREIATLKLAGGKENYDKIGRMLKENALADTTNYDMVYEYACFALEQNDFNEAEQFYKICFKICIDGTTGAGDILKVLSNLGTIFAITNRFKEAEKYAKIVLNICEKVNDKEKKVPIFRELLAFAQNQIGVLYKSQHEYFKAEEYFLKALENYTHLYNQDSSAYRSPLASTQGRLGSLYNSLHEYAKSEEYLLKALRNITYLFYQDPDTYRDNLASTQSDLGNLYKSLHDYTKAEEYYLKALENYTQLFTCNPDAYRNSLATAQYLFGDLCGLRHDNATKERYFLKALENYEILFNKNPDIFRVNLAIIQYSLFFLYADNAEKTEQLDTLISSALTNFEILFQDDESYKAKVANLRAAKGKLLLRRGKTEEALQLLESSDELWPGNADQSLALAYSKRGTDYFHEQDTANAIKCIGRATLYYKLLWHQNPIKFREGLNMVSIYLWSIFRHSAVEDFLLKEEETCNHIHEQNEEKYGRILATIQEILGEYYDETGDNSSKAEGYYHKAMDSYTLLCNTKPETYRDGQAAIQIRLGELYSKNNDFAKAEEYYLKALENYTQLFKQKNEDYLPHTRMAMTQMLLADMYKKTKDYNKAEEYNLKALENYTQLFGKNPDAYHSSLKKSQKSLAELYNEHQEYSKAEELYLKMVEQYTQLLNQKPDSYRGDLASTQFYLGKLYNFDLKDYTKAEEYYLKAVENRTVLFNQNPDEYRSSLANIQFYLGQLYDFRLKEYTKAEEYYLKAMENWTVLFNLNPDEYRASLANIQYNLGQLYYFNLKDYTKAEKYYLKVVENRTVLFNQNPDEYRSSLANIQFYLGQLYDFRLKDYTKAEEYYLKAMENRTVLFNLNPDEYRASLADIFNILAYVYVRQDIFTKAIETIDKAIGLISYEPNYYDSKGEILLMKGDEQGALKMWKKVIELDPDFLSKHNGSTELYIQLKGRGLIE